jgi:hypothetical protein
MRGQGRWSAHGLELTQEPTRSYPNTVIRHAVSLPTVMSDEGERCVTNGSLSATIRRDVRPFMPVTAFPAIAD